MLSWPSRLVPAQLSYPIYRPMKLPQLSLRDLFWLVLVVALGCGWWADRQELSEKIYKLQLGAFARYMDRMSVEVHRHGDDR